MKKCPYCAEEIQDKAIFCRYCFRKLNGKNILLFRLFSFICIAAVIIFIFIYHEKPKKIVYPPQPPFSNLRYNAQELINNLSENAQALFSDGLDLWRYFRLALKEMPSAVKNYKFDDKELDKMLLEQTK